MIYLDHHAATPLGEAAREAMREELVGNPSSVHAAGRRARAALELARERVARSVGATPADVIFTSGGTEACSLGVLGLGDVRRIVSSPLEHPAVRAALPGRGVAWVELPVRPGQAPSVETLASVVEPGDLVALQHASHETGVLADVAALGAVARAAGALLLVDAVASFGRVPVALADADALVLASHKVGGPAGAGALVVRRGVELEPQIRGGGQERGRRGGSPDLRACVGFGAAAAAIPERLRQMGAIAALRDRLEHALVAAGAVVNGTGPRTATVVHVSVLGWRGAELVAALDLEGLACSAGAACSSGVQAASPAITAWYPDDRWRSEGTLRLSLGPETTPDEVERAIAIVTRVLRRA